jgi:ribonuclease HI
MMIQAYTDGLAEPNPGVGTYGYAIYRDGKSILGRHGFAGDLVTNNFAEYSALVELLRELDEFRDEEITVYSDSKLLIGQMSGALKVSKRAIKHNMPGSYVDKFLEARDLARKFPRITFEWIPREMNSQADELSRLAYRERLLKRRGH